MHFRITNFTNYFSTLIVRGPKGPSLVKSNKPCGVHLILWNYDIKEVVVCMCTLLVQQLISPKTAIPRNPRKTLDLKS